MGQIFISYSHKDTPYALKLREALQKEGFEVWIDDRIDYGDEWPMVIQKHLDECDAFILIASDNAHKSKWVNKEVTRAQRIDKAFFPLLLSGQQWLEFESTQYVDVRDQSLPTERFYNQLAVVTMRSKINGEPPPVLITAPKPTPEPRPVPSKPEIRLPINLDRFWNTRTKTILTKLGLGLAIFTLVCFFLLALGRFTGLISTENARIVQSPWVKDVVTSLDSDGNYPDFIFSREQQIFINLTQNYRAATSYTSKWYYALHILGKDVYILITTLQYDSTASNNRIYFQLNNPKIPGYYRVDVYRDGTLASRNYFTIK